MRSHLLKGSSLIIVSFLLAVSGCKKDSSTGPASPISGDLFPVVQGRTLVYTESETDQQNNPVAGTDFRLVTTVGPTVTLSGRTGNYLIDSVYDGNGRFSNLDTLNIVSKGSDGTLYFTVSSSLFSSLPIAIPAVWFPMFQPGAGVGNQYEIYRLDTTFTMQSVTINLTFTLTGVLNQQESVQVPAGTFSAYRGDVTYEAKVTAGGFPFSDDKGTAITMWLVDGIGPVKILYPAGSTSTEGSVEVLIGKNF